ncbi:MAG: insulinase family protein [Rhodospirillaceae bacterium]|nr:insulinase family protein [Rhodospirillaceae bacterium]
MRILFALKIAVLMLVAAAGDARAEVFAPVKFTLDNGLDVVVVSNHRSPVVMQMLWYRVGSIDEPVSKSGMAHLLEHLMFKGTKKHPNGEFSKLVARNGGNENAFTSFDYTGYHQTVSADRLEMVMELEADRMSSLVLSDGDIETESNVILEERRQRIGNSPSGKLRLEVNARLFPNGHPYGRPVIGWEGEIKSITRSDLLDFYKKYYVPSNAVLVVVGDVSPETVRKLAVKYYGPINGSQPPLRPLLGIPDIPKSGEVIVRDARVGQPAWSLNVIAPSLGNNNAGRVAAFEVLAQVLGGGTTSRLYKALVVGDGKAVSAGAGYSSDPMGPGRFIFYASPQPGAKLDAIANDIEKELKKLIEDGFMDGEFERVKKRMLAGAIYVRDELKSGAWALGGALAAKHKISDVEEWPDNIKNVSEAEVISAAKQIFNEKRKVTAKLLPAENNGAGG